MPAELSPIPWRAFFLLPDSDTDEETDRLLQKQYQRRDQYVEIPELTEPPVNRSAQVWNCVERERNVLFNDALNTFYLRLYGVRHMVKDHSDSEKRSPLLPHRLLFPINSKGSFICTIPQTG